MTQHCTLFQKVVRRYLVSNIGIRPTYYDILKTCRTQRLGWLGVGETTRQNIYATAAPILVECGWRQNRWKTSVWVPATPYEWLFNIPTELKLAMARKGDNALPEVARYLDSEGDPRGFVLLEVT